MHIFSRIKNQARFSLLFSFVTLTLLFSCSKDSNQTGSGNVIYRTDYEYPREIKPAGNHDRLILENADPYADALGGIMLNQIGATSDGKPNKFSDWNIGDIMITSAFVKIGNQQSFVRDHFTGSRIVYRYFDQANVIREEVLGNSPGYDNATGTINYSLNTANLIGIFSKGIFIDLYIDFYFDSNDVDSSIRLDYEMAFPYNYTYTMTLP